MSGKRIYAAIDLKSFYASVECIERGLDPLCTNLVVADSARTEKTICLAVSPSLKAYGISGRARLFEVVQRVREINYNRRRENKNGNFTARSYYDPILKSDPAIELDYIVAPPQMAKYMEYSKRIYEIYKTFVSEEDIVVYSVDEVFIDLTDYLTLYNLSAKELTMKMILAVLNKTGITATAGIATNMFLCKVALDIEAKHIPSDKNGVRIAELDEMSFRQKMWDHRPLTDFWRVGHGYASKLEKHGIYTMGDIARCSVGSEHSHYNENLLYDLFGVNAELLIDHAWGYEPCTIRDIKSYRPSSSSMTSGQVLKYPYDYKKTRLVVMEMTDLLVLELVEKQLVTDQVVLTVGYDVTNLVNSDTNEYNGEITLDRYGRKIPKHAHGTAHLEFPTSSTKLIMDAVTSLYDRIINEKLLARRITLVFANIMGEEDAQNVPRKYTQLDIFTNIEAEEKRINKEKEALEKEKARQKTILSIQKKYGKNAMLKGMNLEDGATAKERNQQIGGHKA